ncbi:hypothetical protein JZ751_023054 [Albula glossodonta]|uniref:Uncharacterized protein n=1 Tax=Albula glossodonta TaxID=121402 RepID=A0A8T2PEM7_9TELE|nr:hypothetical protein JZ751_023054 [Albula glossodonta]
MHNHVNGIEYYVECIYNILQPAAFHSSHTKICCFLSLLAVCLRTSLNILQFKVSTSFEICCQFFFFNLNLILYIMY